MKLDLILVLDAMLAELNVGKAGARLGLSQSGMSHALARLREELKDPLFVKTAGGMAATPRAVALEASVAAAMAAARSIFAPPGDFDPGTMSRTFSFVMTDYGELFFLPKILSLLKQHAPGCSVRSLQIQPSEVFDRLEKGSADLAIGHLRWQPEGLHQQPLFKERLMCVASPHHPIARPGWTKFDYWQCAHVVVSLSGEIKDAYDLLPERIQEKRRVIATVSHWLALPELLLGTESVATVSSSLAIRMSAQGYQVLDLPFSLKPFDLRQYWHPRFHNDPALQWLRAQIHSLFAHDHVG